MTFKLLVVLLLRKSIGSTWAALCLRNPISVSLVSQLQANVSLALRESCNFATTSRRLMMNNALKYVKILEGTGITREQAEAHVQIIFDVLEGDLVTKQDLTNSEASIRAAINRLDTKIDTSVERIENKLLQSEYRTTIKLGSIVTIVIAAATAISKLF